MPKSLRYFGGVAVLVGFVESLFFVLADSARATFGFWVALLIVFVLNGTTFFLVELGYRPRH